MLGSQSFTIGRLTGRKLNNAYANASFLNEPTFQTN